MLEGGIPFVCLAEGGAGFDLVDVEGAVGAAVDYIGKDEDIVLEKARLEEIYFFLLV